MKNTKTITLLLFLLFQYALVAQISIEDEEYSNYHIEASAPTVKIKVLNLDEDEREKLIITCSVVTPLYRDDIQMTKTGHLSGDGEFLLQLDYAFPNQQIWLRVGQLFYRGIYVNTDFSIVLDADSLKSDNYSSRKNGVHFEGNDVELNKVLSSHLSYKRKVTKKVQKEINVSNRNKSIEYVNFIAKYDSLYSILHAIDEEYIRQYPSVYSSLIKNERYSRHYGDLCVKHWNKPMDKDLFEQVRNHKVYLTSNYGAGFHKYLYIYLTYGSGCLFDYSQFYDKLNLSGRNTLDSLLVYREKAIVNFPTLTTSNNVMSPDYLKFHNYRKRMNYILGDSVVCVAQAEYMIQLFDAYFEPSKADFYKLKIITDKEAVEKKFMIPVILDNMTQQWCKDILILENEKNEIKLKKINTILQQSETIMPTIPLVTNSHVLAGLGKHLATMPFRAELYKVDTISPKQLLEKLKSGHKNKALILDFWAMWCGPCLADLPHSKALHGELTNEPVEFVYICTSRGTSVEKWKSKIAELQLEGIHLFVDEGIVSELMEMFSFSGFPSYAFINSKGKYKTDAIQRFSHTKKSEIIQLLNN